MSAINFNRLRLNKASPYAVGLVDWVGGNSGISKLTGIIGSANSATLKNQGEIGPALTTTSTSGAFSFGGVLAKSYSLFTLFAWYRILNTSVGFRAVGNFVSATYGYGFIPSVTFRAGIARAGVNTIVSGPTLTNRPVSDVLIYDGSSITYISNGVLAGGASGTMAAPSGNFKIGDDPAALSQGTPLECYVTMLYNYAMPSALAFQLSANPLLPFH